MRPRTWHCTLAGARHLAALVLVAMAATGCAQREPDCDQRCQDETTLRRQFAVPQAAQMIGYASDPAQGGWFGREGLKLRVVFQLNQAIINAMRSRPVRPMTGIGCLFRNPSWKA